MKSKVTDWEILSHRFTATCEKCALETDYKFDIEILFPKNVEVVLHVDHAEIISKPKTIVRFWDKLRWLFK
jgi:hypothetical protein